jgi:hypothetical protein
MVHRSRVDAPLCIYWVWWFVQTFSKYKLLPNLAVGLTEDWQIKSFAEDRLDHSMVHFQTLHGDGSVDAIPHRYMSPINLGWHPTGGRPHCIRIWCAGRHSSSTFGSIEDFRKIYRCLCDSCLPKDRTCALLDRLKRAEEVATEYMWTKSGRKGWKDIDALKHGVIMSEVILLICTLSINIHVYIKVARKRTKITDNFLVSRRWP